MCEALPPTLKVPTLNAACLYRCIGVLVSRCIGVLVYWCIGVSVYRYMYNWYIGVSVYRCCLAYRCNVVSVKSKKLFYKQSKTSKKMHRTIAPKWYQIREKSASDTVLERFGHPPGAKIPQKRHQDQNLMKNVEFLGVPWAPKWNKNPRKFCIKIVMIFVPI